MFQGPRPGLTPHWFYQESQNARSAVQESVIMIHACRRLRSAWYRRIPTWLEFAAMASRNGAGVGHFCGFRRFGWVSPKLPCQNCLREKKDHLFLAAQGMRCQPLGDGIVSESRQKLLEELINLMLLVRCRLAVTSCQLGNVPSEALAKGETHNSGLGC